MRIIQAHPPNYDKILAALPGAKGNGVIFCYGDVIYNPSGIVIAKWLVDHEKVHSDRQGKDPDAWWDRYIEFSSYRLNEEIPAHRAEYASFVEANNANRQQRRAYLSEISSRLSSALYGKLITKDEAKSIILAGNPTPIAAERPIGDLSREQLSYCA